MLYVLRAWNSLGRKQSELVVGINHGRACSLCFRSSLDKIVRTLINCRKDVSALLADSPHLGYFICSEVAKSELLADVIDNQNRLCHDLGSWKFGETHKS